MGKVDLSSDEEWQWPIIFYILAILNLASRSPLLNNLQGGASKTWSKSEPKYHIFGVFLWFPLWACKPHSTIMYDLIYDRSVWNYHVLGKKKFWLVRLLILSQIARLSLNPWNLKYNMISWLLLSYRRSLNEMVKHFNIHLIYIFEHRNISEYYPIWNLWACSWLPAISYCVKNLCSE